MTIDEAIKILDPEHDRGIFTSQEEYDQAKRLAIEAMKWIMANHRSPYPSNAILLPGETEK